MCVVALSRTKEDGQNNEGKRRQAPPPFTILIIVFSFCDENYNSVKYTGCTDSPPNFRRPRLLTLSHSPWQHPEPPASVQSLPLLPPTAVVHQHTLSVDFSRTRRCRERTRPCPMRYKGVRSIKGNTISHVAIRQRGRGYQKETGGEGRARRRWALGQRR